MSDLHQKITALKEHLKSVIVGQDDLISNMLIALLAQGHILLEGAPGLAKTKAIKTLAGCVDAKFKRIQFTPDLLPSDITGSDIYLSGPAKFEFKEGPVFANFVLADEINRAPAKVQSALLEAMAEKQVSVGGKVYALPDLFMVMATQNPIEHEGTYNLPEAQLDRFLMYIRIDQPDAESEKRILHLVRREDLACGADKSCWDQEKKAYQKISPEEILAASQEVLQIPTSEAMENYIVELIMATRQPEKYDEDLKNAIRFGASPRATIALDKCSKVSAWLAGRNFVTPEDVHKVAHEVLRHRIILNFEAEAEGITTDDVISKLLTLVPLP